VEDGHRKKVVRQVGLGILRQYKVGFSRRFSFPPPSFFVRSQLLFLVGAYLQSDPISEDQLMTKWNIAVGDTFISDAHFRRIPLRAFSTLLFEHVNTLIPWAELPIDRDFE
jgi:hypothetical protein